MYRTGDVARWLDNGAVEYLGRSDDQLKFAGSVSNWAKSIA